VPALSVTVGLSVVPVKGELGGVVPDSLLAGFASLVGPAGFTVSGDGVRVSVSADSNTVSSLTVDSVPVVSSGMGSLSFDVSPDTHVVVTGGVLSNDHQITGRSSSNVLSSTSELLPVLSSTFVTLRFEDLVVLADNGGLTVVLNSDSVGGTRGVSVGIELALLEEGNFTSAVDNPDLSVGSGTDINGSHGVRFPCGVLRSERSDDSRVGDGEDFALGGDSNSLGSVSDNFTVLSGLVIKSGSVDVFVGIDGDIRNTGTSVLPGDVIFLLAHLSSSDTVIVVGEDSSGARVVDKSHGGGSSFVGLSGKTDEGLGVLVEVLVDMAVLTASVSDDDGLTTVESDLETSGDLFVSESVPEVLDVGNFTVGLLVDLDRLASHEPSVGDGALVDVVVEVVEHESQLGEEDLAVLLGVTEGDLGKLGEPVGSLGLLDDCHSGGVSAGKSASEIGALFAGNHTGGFTTGGSLANERLLLGAVGVHFHHTTVVLSLGSIESGASFSVVRDGEVSDVILGVTIRPRFNSLGDSSTSPGITVGGNTFESHEVHDSCLLSSLTDGGEVTTPSLASSFSIVPGFASLVVDIVLVVLLSDTSVSGPVDLVVLVDNEGSSSFADSDLTGTSSHVQELAVDSELHDVTVFTGDIDRSFGTGTDIDSGPGVMLLP